MQEAQRSSMDKLSKSSVPALDIKGLVEQKDCFWAAERVAEKAAEVKSLAAGAYEQHILKPVRSTQRISARKALASLFKKLSKEVDNGPLFAAEGYLVIPESPGKNDQQPGENRTLRKVGIIGQNKDVSQGVWGAEHHAQAATLAVSYAKRRMPVITFIDTPGADAGEQANGQLQAHSISRLISTMAQLPVPTIGVIWGTAYSGGAIPLAATNLLLSVEDALFSTIQPQGLANIARKQHLTWQQCAQRASVSASECALQGWVDAIVAYSPVDGREGLSHISEALGYGFDALETATLSGLAAETTSGGDDGESGRVYAQYGNLIRRYASEPLSMSGVNHVFFGAAESNASGLPAVSGYLLRLLRQQQVLSRIRCDDQTALFAQQESNVIALSGASDAVTEVKSAGDDTVFHDWLKRDEKLVYEERLLERYKKFAKAKNELHEERGAFFSLVLGRPEENYQQARQSLCFEVGLYLYNRWKMHARSGFLAFEAYLGNLKTQAMDTAAMPLNAETISAEQTNSAQQTISAEQTIPAEEITLAQLIHLSELAKPLLSVAAQMRRFDALYDGVLGQLELVAQEANRHHQLSRDSVGQLLSAAIEESEGAAPFSENETKAFSGWLKNLMQFCDLDWFLRGVAEWKQHQHARLSESLFVFITYLFEKLIPRYLQAMEDGKPFDGRISPTWIGRRKDFWHRLSVAYCDLQIQALQREYKGHWPTWQGWVDELCDGFEPLNEGWVSSDPCAFPGFLSSLKSQADKGQIPAGMITGLARLKQPGQHVGLFVSNVHFQAGALDMASARKVLALIQQCTEQRLPLVGIVSSGGMQTKEGAGSLFAMAAINEALSLFRQSTGLPVVMIGFGDCTGGAQASFVTHPLVKTWYVSGANIPFAGQIVVPSYLPSTCTLANYLSDQSGAMQGVLSHPFANSFDQRLREIDPAMPAPFCSIQQMLVAELQGSTPLQSMDKGAPGVTKAFHAPSKVLIHARGCTAAKLITDIRKTGTPIVLVQSDPDMTGYPAELLGEGDELVCIGGNTPDESYLNANSVLQVASMTGADALHPGIGFLSEDPDFAKRCQVRGLNFIGPDYRAMVLMGDKSMALKAAIAAGVPVVPGSHGVVNDIQQARKVAQNIGFPLLLKAAFGGGGKGIARLDHADQLAETFTRLSREAEAAFGRGDLYMERFVSSMRHIEVQVLRDRHGHCQLPGMRDCSVQRQNQKLLEESGSTLLPAALEAQAFTYAEQIAHQVDYIGAGTVEFIFDLRNECLYFMEMNTRLQVEHPVTEAVSGVDIVPKQLAIAAGERIDSMQWTHRGYAIEARVNAEQVRVVTTQDCKKAIDCQPSPGLITQLSLPADEHVSVIRCVDAGKAVTPFYDSLIMQVIAVGDTREAAMDRLAGYLRNIDIQGVHTNIRLLVSVLEDAQFYNGEFDTGFLSAFAARISPEKVESEDPVHLVDQADVFIPGTLELKVLAPNTSVFYRSATPEERPFISEGDVIDIHQTLCLMEAMKVFSPLKLAQLNKGVQPLYEEAHKYRVNRILNKDGDQVNAGDLLFVLQPLDAAS